MSASTPWNNLMTLGEIKAATGIPLPPGPFDKLAVQAVSGSSVNGGSGLVVTFRVVSPQCCTSSIGEDGKPVWAPVVLRDGVLRCSMCTRSFS